MESPAIADALARRIEPGADAARISAVLVQLWQEIHAALHPVLGRQGVAALYARSLQLSSTSQPWLALPPAPLPGELDLAPLQVALARQPAALAAVGGALLLHNFHALLASLVGPSLTDRLLRSVWEGAPGSPDGQESSP